jgi:hypothetical protein
MAGKPLLDKYQKIAQAPTGLPESGRLRLFLQGDVGSGKTFFGASWPRVALLDFENKTSAVRRWGEGSMAFHFKTGKEYLDLIDELVADGQAGKCPFDMVVFDTVLGFRALVREHLTNWYRGKGLLKDDAWDITDYKGEGAGWSILNGAVADAFERLYHQGGLGWMAFAHITLKWRKVKGKEVSSWESVLNPGILEYVHDQCEFCAYFDKGYEEIKTELPPRTLPGGKVIPGGVRAETRELYKLRWLPPGSNLPTRIHIPFELPDLVIPEGRGYETFDAAYAAAKTAWTAEESTQCQKTTAPEIS